jgi:hypothetical protein
MPEHLRWLHDRWRTYDSTFFNDKDKVVADDEDGRRAGGHHIFRMGALVGARGSDECLNRCRLSPVIRNMFGVPGGCRTPFYHYSSSRTLFAHKRIAQISALWYQRIFSIYIFLFYTLFETKNASKFVRYHRSVVVRRAHSQMHPFIASHIVCIGWWAKARSSRSARRPRAHTRSTPRLQRLTRT